ncbi:MAG: exo-alpha-sialidase [Spirochaetales bacterium]|nr:exo-alpha-sialidase [Spirochaetales bacterium]
MHTRRFLTMDTAALIAALIQTPPALWLLWAAIPVFEPQFPFLLMFGTYILAFPLLGIILFFLKPKEFLGGRRPIRFFMEAVFYVLVAMMVMMHHSVAIAVDPYQPFSSHPIPSVIITITGFVYAILFGIAAVVRGKGYQGIVRRCFVVWPILLLFLPFLYFVHQKWNAPQWNGPGPGWNPIFVPGKKVETFRNPALLTIPSSPNRPDTLLAFAEARMGTSKNHGKKELVLRRSQDGGRTWQPIQRVRPCENPLGNAFSPAPIYDATQNTVFLLYGTEMNDQNATTWMMTSHDEGTHWTSPVKLGNGMPSPGHGTILNQGTENSLFVISGWDDQGGFLWLSENGQDWFKSDTALTGRERHLASLENGLLVASVRTYSNSRYFPHTGWRIEHSFDGGMEWERVTDQQSSPRPGALYPIAPSMDGRLWRCGPTASYALARLELDFSQDDGQSWTIATPLYSGPSGSSDLVINEQRLCSILGEYGRTEFDEMIGFAQFSLPEKAGDSYKSTTTARTAVVDSEQSNPKENG